MIVIPTIQQLYSGYKTEIESNLGIQIPPIGKSFIRALCGVLAAKDKLIYLCVASVQKNIFVDTADPEALGGTLERFGRVKLGRNPMPAQAGIYNVTVTGTSGGTIPASTTFKSNDDSLSPGKLFVLDNAFALSGVTETISLRALDAGTDSILSIGDKLTATAPIPLVDAIATVLLETGTPLPAQTIEDYRKEVIDSYRLETQGGSASDYRLWSKDAVGIKQVYPYAKSGAPNEVNVFVEATINNGVPTTGILTDVAAVIDQNPKIGLQDYERGRRPVGIFAVNVLPVTLREVVISFTGFVDFATYQTALQSALTTEIAKIRPFVAGSDVLADRNDTLSVGRINSIIFGVVPNAQLSTVNLSIDGSNITVPFQFIQGNIPHLNTITNA